jgi:hypothetical protein
MNRRTFNKLAGMSVPGAMTEGTGICGQGNLAMGSQSGSGEEIVLEVKQLRVAFDKSSGALTPTVRKSANWVVERRPGLGASFRLLVPLPELGANLVLGQKQHAASIQKTSGNRVEMISNEIYPQL